MIGPNYSRRRESRYYRPLTIIRVCIMCASVCVCLSVTSVSARYNENDWNYTSTITKLKCHRGVQHESGPDQYSFLPDSTILAPKPKSQTAYVPKDATLSSPELVPPLFRLTLRPWVPFLRSVISMSLVYVSPPRQQ